MMALSVMTPAGVVLERQASKVLAHAPNGFFCLKPRHADFVSALAPGIFTWWDADGAEAILALDQGLLVKVGARVRVACLDAVAGQELGALRQAVAQRFQNLDDRDKKARTALARIEAGLVRRFLEL